MPHYRLHPDPQSSHQQIATLLKNSTPKATLDVGAAQGFLGQLIAGSNLTIDAIEPDPQCAAMAAPYYRSVHNSTIEAAELPPCSYDAVVCADVLEHLPNPLAALEKLKLAATSNAAFIISVPNVAHIAIRFMLLFGKFPKMDRGILDKTHLQFFTRDTAAALIQSAGLKISSVSAAGVPLDEVFKNTTGRPGFKALNKLQYLLVKALPRLFAMQWIFIAHKP
jgi:2-polyprenyl-3-methyl-5-hydroxy-6-metoxy-1,4-benzoquinol methylase